MLEFLKENYFIPLYGITLVVALLRYRLYYDSVLKHFPIIIAYTLFSEILGILIRDYESFQIVYLKEYDYANYLIYNIYDVICFLYFYRVFWKVIRNSNHKKVVKWGALIYVVSVIINPFFQNVLIFPQIAASTVGSLVLVISILLFLKGIRTNQDKKSDLLLWISLGLLIFNLFFPFILITGRFDYDLYQNFNFKQFHYFLIVAMYSCFIIGFLKMKRFKLG